MITFNILMTFFISYVPLLAFFAITPYITRKTESFGVSIPHEVFYDPEVKEIRDGYRTQVFAFGGVFALFVLLLSLTMPQKASVIFIPVGTFVQLAIMFVLYLSGHKRMKALKAEKNWSESKLQVVVVDTGFRSRKNQASPLWFLLHFAVIFATAAFTVAVFDSLPGKLPMHWNINGEIDRWADKSYSSLMFVPMTQTFILIVFLFVYWIIGKAKQQVDAADPEKSLEQNRIFRYTWSVFTIIASFAVILLFVVMDLSILGYIKNQTLITTIPFIVGGGIIISSIILSITVGQGGSRLSKCIAGKSGASVSRDDDKYWKLGMFYYNPDDPALFVEKRFGIGWTSNFARPASWAIIIGFILFVILMTYFSTRMTK